MKCSYCGTENSNTTNCVSCGGQLPQENQQAQQNNQQPTQFQQPNQIPTPNPYQPMQMQDNSANSFAIASLVLGLCGFLGLCSPIIGIICSIIGMSLSVKGKTSPTKAGLAKAGLILSIIALVLSIGNMIAGFLLSASTINEMLDELSRL